MHCALTRRMCRRSRPRTESFSDDGLAMLKVSTFILLLASKTTKSRRTIGVIGHSVSDKMKRKGKKKIEEEKL